MATRIDYVNSIKDVDMDTIYLTGAGYVNYPFKGVSRDSALGWDEPVWGSELNRGLNLVMDNIDTVDYGMVARCEISFKYMNVQDYKVLCKISKQRVCIANFFNRETGERVTQEMAFTGNEISKLYKFGEQYLGVLDISIKLVATNRDRVNEISASHTVTYNANGGSGTINSTTVKWAGQTSLANSGFTRSNAVLHSWNTQSGGTGEEYSLGQKVTVFGDLTLYAQWVIDTELISGTNFRALLLDSELLGGYNNTTKEIIFDNYTGLNEYIVDGVNLIEGLSPTTTVDSLGVANLYKYNNGEKVLVLVPKYTNIFANADSSRMFKDFEVLEKVKFNNFNTSQVTNMSAMFYNDSRLNELNLDKFNTSNVEDMSNMFSYCQSQSLRLDLSSFNTENVTTMNSMFYSCKTANIDISSFNFYNVQNLELMFYLCSNIKSLKFTTNDFSNATTVRQMFLSCTSLKTIYTNSDWIFSQNVNSSTMFKNCNSLVGQNGTTYSSSNEDKTYARIDTPSTPGYFTAIV
jgi:surface protein